MLMVGEGVVPSKVKFTVTSGENTLHGMAGRVSRSGGSLLEASTAQVVVVTDQTLEASPSEVAPHTGVTGDTLVPRHPPQFSGAQSG